MNKNKITLIILIASILACSVIMPFKTIGRNLFYCSAILIILISLTNAKRFKHTIKKEDAILAFFLFFLGLAYISWAYRFPAHPPGVFMADMGYMRSGIYLMIGSGMILCLSALLKTIPYNNGRVINNTILAGFLFLTAYALHYHFIISDGRLRINNSATLSAYLYVYYSLITIYSLAITRAKFHNTLILIVVFVSLYVVILTQTRAAIIIYPLILIVSFFQSHSLQRKNKFLITVLFLFGLIATIGYHFKPVVDRVEGAVSEIAEYNTNNVSSAGARISMWRTGLMEIYNNPTGVSSQQRYVLMSKLIQEKERGNREALRNLVYHLHNDLIDTMSLQGVFAGIMLIGVYLSLIFYIYKKQIVSCGAVMLCSPIFFFGAVDCLFIHDQFIIMFITSLVIFAGISQVTKLEHYEKI